ncbi:hypothetical protein [Streptomyces sp. NPDC059564]|uniref:hypothetical protein n=1 Tax=Streptomyces sp. NPDC059564 TaxID=3346865 RepID=UPI0036A0A8EA
MNSEEPRQGWPTPPGYPPSGPAYGGPGGPPPSAPPSAPPSPSPHRGAWIGAGATLVAAVIGVVGAYLVGNGGGKGTPAPVKEPVAAAPPGGGAQGAAPSDPALPQSSPPPAASAPRTPSGKPPGTVQWEGALAVEFAEPKDFDAAPPVRSEVNSDNDFSVYSFGNTLRLRPEGGAKVLVWEDAAKAPSYEDCAGVVDTMGSTKDMDLKTGRVFCGRTKEGRLVRLTTQQIGGLGGDARGAFDVLVWSK